MSEINVEAAFRLLATQMKIRSRKTYEKILKKYPDVFKELAKR